MNHAQLVTRKLARLFPDPERRAEASSLLDFYGAEPHHREVDRVQLALLKLAGADLDRLLEYALAADADYRDVLAWAEYPNQAQTATWRLGATERERLAALDRAHYEAWADE